MENYIQEGSLEAGLSSNKIFNECYKEGPNDSTVFTHKSRHTEESVEEYPPSSSVLKKEEFSSHYQEDDSSTKKSNPPPKHFVSNVQPQSLADSYTTSNQSRKISEGMVFILITLY